MTAVLLMILRVIGLILLVLLCTILVLLLLILFMPIVYRIKAQKQDQAELNVKIRWLFGLIRAKFQYPDPGRFTVKVLFFTVFETGGEEPTNENVTQEEDDLEKELLEEELLEDASLLDSEAPDMPSIDQSKWSDHETGHEADPAEGQATDHEKAWREAEDKLHGESVGSKFDKIKYTIRNSCDKIKDTWKNINYYKDILTDDETRQLLDHALLRIGRILKGIRPRRLEGDLLFGTGSPDTTGYILGVYAMFSPILGNCFQISPNFEEKILKGRFYAAGHITIANILWQIILLVLDKKLWHLISKVKKEKKHGKQRK